VSPYSDEIAQRVQWAVYKRLAAPEENQMAFANPPYALLPLYPLILLPFEWSSACWIAFLLLALVTGLILAFPNAPRWAGPSFLLFYPAFFGLLLGNFAVLIGTLLLLLFGRYLPQRQPAPGWQIAAGVVLAWLTIKPQFTWPYLLFFGLLGLRRRQWHLLAAAAGSFVLFAGVSFLLVPNWPVEWVERITRYIGYTQAWPISTFLLMQFIPLPLAEGLTALMVAAALALTAWLAWRWWQGRLPDLPLLAWLGLIGFWFHPRGTSYEHIAFLLPLILWACTHPRPRSAAVLAWWLSSLVVSWLVFFIAGSYPPASEWPILFHALWVAWLFAGEKAAQNRLKILPKPGTSAII
jgi:hypothetical protein